MIYAGQGVLLAEHGPQFLKQLAELADIPVCTTLLGLGAFDEHSSRSLHMVGMHGSAYANMAMQHADVILALGARFDDRVTGNLAKFAPEAKQAAKQGTGGIIHMDISPKEVNKVVEPTVAVIGDLAETLPKLLQFIEPVTPEQRQVWWKQIAEWKQKYPFTWSPPTPGREQLIKPQQVIAMLNDHLKDRKENVVLTTGVGQHQMWAAQFYRHCYPRSFITSGGLGTMGFGLPAAIGAKIALGRDKLVVDIDGDASFCMTAMELFTAVQYGINVRVLILNNVCYGMMKQWHELVYEKQYNGASIAYGNPDFVKLAQALGADARRCTMLDHVQDALEWLCESDAVIEEKQQNGVRVLECVVDADEHVFPMVELGGGLHEMKFGPAGHHR